MIQNCPKYEKLPIESKALAFGKASVARENEMKIGWIIPGVAKASGGTRTIVQAVNALVKTERHECLIVLDIVCQDFVALDEARNSLVSEYGLNPEIAVVDLSCNLDEYDCLVATLWTTAETVRNSLVAHKVYFVQDFEPWFYSMGDEYLEAQNTYRIGLKPLTIGRWLSHKLCSEYDSAAHYFDFCADARIYKPLDIKRNRAICALHQPGKPRRCDKMLVSALRLVKQLAPDVEIYLYGSDKTENPEIDFDHTNLGTLSPEECNRLYNKCQAGICCSSSNPSRIPFEMMAAGLPPIDIFGENTSFDYLRGSILLAEANPEALATAVLQLLSDEDMRAEISARGIALMKERPLENESANIVDFFDRLSDPLKGDPAQKLPQHEYTQGLTASEEILKFSRSQKRHRFDAYRSRQLSRREGLSETTIDSDAFELIIDFTEGYSPKGQIQAAVWCKDDQSDIIWYTMHPNKDASYKTTVLCKEHEFCSGIYQIHVYDVGKNGEPPICLGAFERNVLCPNSRKHLCTNIGLENPSTDRKRYACLQTRPLSPAKQNKRLSREKRQGMLSTLFRRNNTTASTTHGNERDTHEQD